MTREEYNEQRNPLASALEAFDTLYPNPPPGAFDIQGGIVNTSSPTAPGVDFEFSQSDSATSYVATLYDGSENYVHHQDLWDNTSAENLFSGQMDVGHPYSIIVVAHGPVDERQWDAAHWHFST